MTTDRTPRTIVALGLVAALVASCTPAHAGERHPRPIVHGPSETFIRIVTPKASMGAPAPKATPSTPTVAPTPVCKAPGLYPLTFDSPALPPSTYLHPAYPEARPVYASPASSYGHGTTRTHGTVHTPHGSVTFDSTTRH